jgi:hypothetical protein
MGGARAARDAARRRGRGLGDARDGGCATRDGAVARAPRAERPSSLGILVDRPDFSFADFSQNSPARQSTTARDELLGFILQIHAQLREFELDLVNGEALAALQ